MDAWEKFKKTVSNTLPVTTGDRIVLAVSGGPDSVCLTHLFWRLRKTVPLDLFIVHLDHGLRRAAKKDAAFVRSLGERLSVPVTVREIPVREYARDRHLSLEAAGRELRYRELISFAVKNRCRFIATGHTADDNAETVLMWLIRGTGTEGLAGIPAVRQEEKGVRIIRPILPVTRSDIMEYLKRQRLSYRTDESNAQLDYTRNRIRHRVIPLLKTYNPGLVEHLFNLSRIVSQENDLLGKTTDAALARSVRVYPTRIVLDLKVFFRYNKVIQQRLLRKLLPEKRTLARIEQVRDLIFSERVSEMPFSRTWCVRRTPKALTFVRLRGKTSGTGS